MSSLIVVVLSNILNWCLMVSTFAVDWFFSMICSSTKFIFAVSLSKPCSERLLLGYIVSIFDWLFWNMEEIWSVVSVELWQVWSFQSPIEDTLSKTVDCFLLNTVVIGGISTRSKMFDYCNENVSLEWHVLELLRIDICFPCMECDAFIKLSSMYCFHVSVIFFVGDMILLKYSR